MSSSSRPYNSTSSSQSYAPSAPALPESYDTTTTSASFSPPSQYNYYWQQQPPPPPRVSGGGFPSGTSPDVINSFQMVDRDRSGFIDERELQEALSSFCFGRQKKFQIRTIRLLMFLFNETHDSFRVGPREFAAVWSCLEQWRAIFQRYDRDSSGKIDLFELRDALYGIGYAIPPSILQVLISKYEDGSGRKVELVFDNFVECGMIVKGLTEKFKQRDVHYSGTATFNYDEFMSVVLPFLVSYD